MLISKLLLLIFTWFSFNTVFHLEQRFYFLEHTVFNVLYKHFKLIESSPQLNII